MKKNLFIFFLLSLVSCSLLDSFDDIPIFLISENVTLTTSAEQGANTQKILDLSIYENGTNIGVFNIPSDIPVLNSNEGSDKVLVGVRAGIRNNGAANNPVEYPFYATQEYEFDYEAEKRIPFDLDFKYRDDTKFDFVEGFEGTHIFNTNLDLDSEVTIIKSSQSLSGQFAGKITIDADNPNFEFASDFRFSIDNVGSFPVYLELDYKNEIPFQIGILGFNQSLGRRDYKIVLIESEEWNKIYIEFTNEITQSGIEEYQLIFRNANNSDQFGSIWIDNIKLVHF